jgi:hypothetical protein
MGVKRKAGKVKQTKAEQQENNNNTSLEEEDFEQEIMIIQ